MLDRLFLPRGNAVIFALVSVIFPTVCESFVVPTRNTCHATSCFISQRPHHTPLFMGYVSPEQPESDSKAGVATKTKSLHPKVGDMVRYYDVDGGRDDGEVLVGRITFITANLGKEKSWTAEITELEDVGDGFYAEYPSRKRSSKRAIRNLADVSPIMASFVRSENAYRVPLDAKKRPQVRADKYDVDDYEGPFSGENAINKDVIVQDGIIYSELKGKLIRNAAIAALAGTVLTDLVKGLEDAVIYGAGALASLGYLFFLSVKTDTVGSSDSRLGKNVSNLRFLMPVLVVVGVALYNKSLGDASPVKTDNPFDTVTTEQFAAAIIGFLTYRIPLFLTQLAEGIKAVDGDVPLPGSAGIAMKMAMDKTGSSSDGDNLFGGDSLTPVLVVSGPTAAGRPELVDRLISEGGGRYIRPKQIDRVKDGVTFERLQNRDEFLQIDKTGRYGITKDGILQAAEGESESVVVIDADVDLAKKLTKISGARLIGVWVGLDSVKEFEKRLEAMVDSGEIPVDEGETKESIIRARIKQIVQEIEFGLSSGIFEFTILNENEEESLKQLREAANYAFK